jgi:hypothetical protein
MDLEREERAFIDWLHTAYFGSQPYLRFWARAPGHAWTWIDMDTHRDGAVRLALPRSGEIEVVIHDRLDRRGVHVELSHPRSGDSRVPFWPAPNEPLRIESLAQGDYVVLLVEESKREGRSVLMRNNVKVEVGATARVVFTRSR